MMSDPEATRDSEPLVAVAARPGSASDIVSAWAPISVAKVADSLSLTPKDYAADYEMDSFTIAGASGTIKCYEGPGEPNIAWCSGLEMNGPDAARGAVAAFVGPLTDVPHLVCACGVSDGGIDVYIDWRPRAECAYDPACATLDDYPSPETREAFA